MTSAHTILLLSGADEYRKRKALHKLVQTRKEQGWRVAEVQGSDHNYLSKLLTGSSLFKAKQLVIVMDPEGVDEALVQRYQTTSPVGVTLVLYVDGEPTGILKKWAKELPAKAHLNFPKVAPWKQLEDAVALCKEELRASRKTISEKLATQVVEAVGTSDFGFVSQEMFKLTLLLDALGETEVLPQHVAATLVLLAEAAVFPVLDALGDGNTKKLAIALSRVENTTAGDPTVKVTRLLAPTLGKWISAAALAEKKVSAEDAAATLGQNAWVYSKKILPPAKRWGLERLVELLGIIAEAESQVFRGVISPWLHLEAGLIRSCQRL